MSAAATRSPRVNTSGAKRVVRPGVPVQRPPLGGRRPLFQPPTRPGARRPPVADEPEVAPVAGAGAAEALGPRVRGVGPGLILTYTANALVPECEGMVSIIAPAVDEVERAPMELVCVIDRSSSMRKSKLDLVKKSLSFIVSQLNQFDSFGVVSYSDNVTVDIPLLPATIQNRARWLQTIARMVAAGSTNLSGGMSTGLQQFASNPRRCRTSVRSVFLLTDGMANKGEVTTDGIQRCLTHVRARCPDVALHTFGFGDGHNAGMLAALAETGRGEYMYVAGEEQLAESFAVALGGLVSVAAQCISLTLTNPTGATPKPRTSFPCTAEGTSWVVEIGDMYGEERRDILTLLENGAVAHLRYFGLQTGTWVDETVVCEARVLLREEALLVAAAASRHATAQAMMAANAAAAAGRLEEAQSELRRAKKKVADVVAMDASAHPGVARPACFAMLSDDLDQCLATTTSAQYARTGSKNLNWLAGGHAKQRARGSGAYTNSAQRKMTSAIAVHAH
eukprot:CAMPEP_0204283528 /NCGR_PEP_ID=MMETSP0468-20130131/46313_1 /ASSEMBLY_ACC=CAM_ASM_000383 /TAXON_ID=2969 /ORGANISM="Oxyrrhis marina" /LENGTH=507 /DNA_ID=CAMNT_0051261139 /DNA_START=39 /DNA_END=1562 /DNA_ORIENTATION=+